MRTGLSYPKGEVLSQNTLVSANQTDDSPTTAPVGLGDPDYCSRHQCEWYLRKQSPSRETSE